jgi:excisionase family DNA binding protein
VPESGAVKQTWVTLGAASQLLGVSESTIRRWADAGEVRSYRTNGGHRRILESDLHQIVAQAAAAPGRDADRISDIALGRVKRRLSRGRQNHTMVSLEGLSDEGRSRLRLMGRQMVDLFARYISSGSRGDRFREDARTIGHEYGRMLVESGIGLTAAVATFNQLRRSLEETASQIATEAGLPTDEAVEAVEHTLELADIVLEGMAEVYEGKIPTK